MDACKVEGCSGFPVAKGLCGTHYQRLLRTGTTEVQMPKQANLGLTCAVRGCNMPARSKRMCTQHYKTAWRLAKKEEMDIDEYIEKRMSLTKNSKPFVLKPRTRSA